MGEILLWAARCKGPVSHFWFQHNSTYRRVCDGELWPKGSPVELDGEALPCRSCKELYVEDVVYGGQVLTLATSDFTPNEPSCDGVQALHSGVVPGYNGVEPHRNGVSPLSKGFGMLRIALSQFANFYEARPAGQVRIVRQMREQLASSEMFRRHNFWGFFHDQLRRTHLASGDIRDFEDRLPAFVSNLADARKQHPYMELGRAYIEGLHRLLEKPFGRTVCPRARSRGDRRAPGPCQAGGRDTRRTRRTGAAALVQEQEAGPPGEAGNPPLHGAGS